jgi:Papain family cysteine protease
MATNGWVHTGPRQKANPKTNLVILLSLSLTFLPLVYPPIIPSHADDQVSTRYIDRTVVARHEFPPTHNTTHGLGLDITHLRKAVDVPPIDPEIFAVESFSGVAELGDLRDDETQNQSVPVITRRGPGSSSVDWRDRFGINWLATIQDQASCESCWAFASAALVETQSRIEHGYWDKRSEGDVRDTTLVTDGLSPNIFCDQTGWPSHALDVANQQGAADLQCFPYHAFEPDPYTPCSLRSGRTTKIPKYTDLGSVDQQKMWLDLIGPLIGVFHVPSTFEFGVYQAGTVLTTPVNPVWIGSHAILIVGYDDARSTWIIRNSWGPGFGDNGYALIGYGQVDIDVYSKQGLQFVNPDPWVKSRLHNGNMIHSGNGAYHKNFELIRCDKTALSHLWRDGTTLNWNLAPSPADLTSPGDHCRGMPAFTETTFDRNFEMVYWERSGNLRHRYYVQSTGLWIDGGKFGGGDVAGYPAYIQSNYGPSATPGGNFEVVVRHDDGSLRHWWRDNFGHWTFGATIAECEVKMSGPSLVQANVGTKGNFYVVAVMESGRMRMYWRNNDDASQPWAEGEEFGHHVDRTPPVMIQSNYGTQDENGVGNFELLVSVDGCVQHWRRNNNDLTTQRPQKCDNGEWTHVTSFGKRVRHVWSLLQGPFYQHLEAIVELRDGSLQHWYWDTVQWNPLKTL